MNKSQTNKQSPSPIHFAQQISTCLHAFEQQYEKKQFAEAFEQLYCALALLEQIDDRPLKNHVLISCVKASAILMSIEGSKDIISSTIASHSLDDHAENLSMGYYLLSQAMRHEKNAKEAIMHAKMAYFYAKQIDGNREFYECNAKLQLICSLLEAKKYADAKHYIDKFNWYLEHCTNDADRVLVLSIQTSIQLLEQQEELAIPAMTALLEKFSQSEDVMYTSFLAMHFRRMLQLRPEYQLRYHDVIKQCEQIIQHFTQLSIDLSRTVDDEYTIHSNYFYRRAYQIVEAHNKQQLGTYLVKFTLQDKPDVIRHLLATYKQKNLPHLLYQYTYGHFMFITSLDGMMLFHSFMNGKETLTIINSVLMKHAADQNFFDLYNELNTRILEQNLTQSYL
ncbi:MAG: hypothetical protein ABS948_15520 [Solibacillus sp.]